MRKQDFNRIAEYVEIPRPTDDMNVPARPYASERLLKPCWARTTSPSSSL